MTIGMDTWPKERVVRLALLLSTFYVLFGGPRPFI
jgi:hypothetical protein